MSTNSNDLSLPVVSSVEYFTSLKRMLADVNLQTTGISPTEKRPLANLAVTNKLDPIIALLDAWAVALEVLSFYQQQYSKENYLTTANELFSIRQLARTIHYELNPGVAASTALAFTVDETLESSQEVKVPRGTRVQSIPGQEQLPQTFETSEDLTARADWNLLNTNIPVLLKSNEIKDVQASDASLRLQGIDTSLRPGDIILLIGTKRLSSDPIGEERLAVYPSIIKTVEINQELGFTKITWNNTWSLISNKEVASVISINVPNEVEFTITLNRPISYSFDINTITLNKANNQAIVSIRLDDAGIFQTFACQLGGVYTPGMLQGAEVIINGFLQQSSPVISLLKTEPLNNMQVFALRSRAACFGNNAPTPVVTDSETDSEDQPPKDASDATIWQDPEVPGYYSESDINLDQLMPQIVANQWLLCVTPNYQQLFKVASTREASVAGYGMSGRATALDLLTPDGAEIDINKNDNLMLRKTAVYTQSEQLTLYTEKISTITPIHAKPYITLDKIVNGLQAGHMLAISSTAQDVIVTIKATITYDAAGKIIIFKLEKPLAYRYQAGTLIISNDKLSSLSVNIRDPGTYQQLYAAVDGDFQDLNEPGMNLYTLQGKLEVVSETFTIDGSSDIDGRTRLLLQNDLEYFYHPAATEIYANAVTATHGETIEEIIGSGDGSSANQRFALSRMPLTYISAPTVRGIASTLEIRVNGIRWQEVASLLDMSPNDKAYEIQQDDKGTVAIIFGDGIHGARLPTGEENVHATYRIGIGLSGQLPIGSVSLLQTQPQGIKGVTNPVPASGAAEPETIVEAKRNIPFTVKALDRIVSIQDFASFVSTFAGIAKSQANIVRTKEGSMLHITIAGFNGAAIAKSSSLYQNLVKAIEQIRDQGPPLIIQSYQSRVFNVSARLLVDKAYLAASIISQAKQYLLDRFSFAAREFAQGVAASDIVAALLEIDGIIAVNVDYLYEEGRDKMLNDYLSALSAGYSSTGITPAELLTINSLKIDLRLNFNEIDSLLFNEQRLAEDDEVRVTENNEIRVLESN